MDSTSTCNTKLLGKDAYRKYNKQPKSKLLNHHLMKSNQINSVEKLTTKELYLISLQHETTTSTSQKYFESTVNELTFQWKDIYTLPRTITTSSKSKFCKHNASLCSFCNLEGETSFTFLVIVLKLNDYSLQ